MCIGKGEGFEALEDYGILVREWLGGYIVARLSNLDARYATTTQSLRSIASSATALVKSTVRRTEFICRRMGSKGASSITRQTISTSLMTSHRMLETVLSYSRYYRSSCLPALLDTWVNNRFSLCTTFLNLETLTAVASN